MVLAQAAGSYICGSWTVESVVRLIVAAALGAVIGLEREQHGRSAGLRTHMLVALGAAIAMVVSLHFAVVFGDRGGAVQVDPARVAYSVMAGIGFLGAGAIIHYGAGVRGLTTAAGLWCAAAIGLASGFGMFVVAGVATGIVVFALAVLDYVERLIPQKVSKTVRIDVPDTSDEAVERYRAALIGAGAKVVSVSYSRDYGNGRANIAITVTVRARRLRSALKALRDSAPELTSMSVE